MGGGFARRDPFTVAAQVVPAAHDASPAPNGEAILVRVSHYWPPLGPPNCGEFTNQVCVSRMASGEPWEDWVDKAIACPLEWEFGTRLVIAGRDWVCMDHGGAIVIQDSIAWVDMLTPEALYAYGTVVEAVRLSE